MSATAWLTQGCGAAGDVLVLRGRLLRISVDIHWFVGAVRNVYACQHFLMFHAPPVVQDETAAGARVGYLRPCPSSPYYSYFICDTFCLALYNLTTVTLRYYLLKT